MKTVNKIARTTAAALLSGLIAMPALAQLPEHLRDYPLASPRSTGDIVAPMFNGWIKNDDGSVTMVFGFANRNTDEVVNIPLGPNNKLEPAQFDGAQPTHFPHYSRGGFVGIQERGTFAVTVPADMAGTEVVWTLNHAGHSYSVPGRATSTAYEMSRDERALGTLTPAIRFDLNGNSESNDVEGIYASPLVAEVGKPMMLTAYAKDRGNRGAYPEVEQDLFPIGTEWIVHQGPASVDFEPARITGRERDRDGEGTMTNGWEVVTTQATFYEPGDYVIRLRVDNFSAPDSQFDNVCCWSNAYVPVTVTP